MTGSENGWLEAAIAWEVCASLHRHYCKGRDALFTTRQSDFVKHAEDARDRASRGQASTQPVEKWSDRVQRAHPKSESAAPRLRAMATNYLADHLWDKLDATTCIRGALEIEALRAARVQADSVLEDAARYRYLRDGTLVDGAINEDLYVHIDSSAYPGRWALVGAELDEAVDAARAAQKKGREKP